MKWLGLMVLAAACAAPPVVRLEPNPERQAWQQRLASRDAAAPLVLRYNPAPCNCPAFELQLAERWLRAELVEADPAWLAWLAATPPESWPVTVQAGGRVTPQLLRTSGGLYAIRIDKVTVVSPLPPPQPEATVP
jgi:hypothetical protein